jgi:hypothetical protein
VLQYQAVAAPVTARGDFPQLAWTPRYPDAIHRRVLPLAARPVTQPNLDPLPNPEPFNARWDPSFPPAVARRTLPVAQQQAVAQGVVALFVTQDPEDPRWQPIIPAWLARRVLTAALASELTEPPGILVPTLVSGWEGEAPVAIARRGYPVAARTSLAAPVEPIASVVSSDLGWIGTYPVGVDGRRFRVAFQQAAAANLDPLPLNALVPLSWNGTYPDSLAWRDRTELIEVVAPPDLIEVVTQQAPWRSGYPDRLAGRPLLVALLPQAILPTPRTVLVAAYDCVELDLTDVTQARLRVLGVTQSQSDGTHVEETRGPGWETC